ncbi:hypothetical protein [Telluribacter humicola]|uniref:hypothetical protein n=1 Tax=Telluribacter humicola TaxID=1720261 RepID=UPI001A9700A2|nr:hypothetical protein [Telluribacter humicola]
MKYCKAFIVAIVLLGGLAFSCTRKDPNLGVPDDRVVGTWRLFKRLVPQDSATLVKDIPNLPAQTLVFNGDGTFAATGEELEYYRSSRYYRMDSTLLGEWRLGFIINNLNPTFYQKFSQRGDTLVLLPSCEGDCGLYFVKTR